MNEPVENNHSELPDIVLWYADEDHRPVSSVSGEQAFSILWPFFIGKVYVREIVLTEVNLFQKYVLAVLSAVPMTAKEVSDVLLLDVRLVDRIYESLLAKEFIDIQGRITATGRVLVDQNEQEIPEKSDLNYFFVDAVFGELWPRYCTSYREIKIKKISSRNTSLHIGQTGEEFDIPIRAVVKPEMDDIGIPPSLSQINRSLMTYQHDFRQSVSGANDPNKVTKKIPLRLLASKYERKFVSFTVVPYHERPGWIALDPFGVGKNKFASQKMSLYLQRMPDNKLSQLLNSLSRQRRMTQGAMQVDRERKTWSDAEKYVLKTLNNKKEGLGALYDELVSLEKNRMWSKFEEAVKACHICIEYILTQYYCRFGDSSNRNVFKTDADTNAEFLTQCATSVGFTIEETPYDYWSFLLISDSQIPVDILDQIDLKSGVALNLVAAERDPYHPFHSLAKRNPDLLIQLSQLKRYRDIASHGDLTRSDNVEGDLKTWYQNVYLLLSYITKVYKEVGDDVMVISDHQPDIELLNEAHDILIDSFGEKIGRYQTPYRLLLKMNVELFKWNMLDPYRASVLSLMSSVSRECIVSATRSVEACLSEMSRQSNDQVLSLNQPDEHRDYLEQAAKQLGFQDNGNGVYPPNLLKNYFDTMIAADTGKGTIAALIAALVIQASNDTRHSLRQIAIIKPDLLLEISELSVIRGHGAVLIDVDPNPVCSKATGICRSLFNFFS